VAVSGIAIWSFSRGTPQPPVLSGVEQPPAGRTIDPGATIIQGPTTTIVAGPDQIQATATPSSDMRPGESIGTRPGVTARAAAPRPSETSAPTSEVVTPARRPTAGTPPPAVDTSGELNALRDDYDNLSLRGGVIDDALNQLWEEMKPNSPRLDMVTHQRSLRTNLARSKDALADRDVAGARRYLAMAREDLEALERFLNRYP
jgi:hypothetical protein